MEKVSATIQLGIVALNKFLVVMQIGEEAIKRVTCVCVCGHVDRKGTDEKFDCTHYIGPHRLSSVCAGCQWLGSRFVNQFIYDHLLKMNCNN
jgi:hypothetical protein